MNLLSLDNIDTPLVNKTQYFTIGGIVPSTAGAFLQPHFDMDSI